MLHAINTSKLPYGVYRITEENSSEQGDTGNGFSGKHTASWFDIPSAGGSNIDRDRPGSGFQKTGSGFFTPRTGSGLDRNRTGSGFVKPKVGNGIHRNSIGGSFKDTARRDKDNLGFQSSQSGSGLNHSQSSNGLNRSRPGSGINRSRPGSGISRSRPGSGISRNGPGSGRVSPIIPPSPTGSEVNILPSKMSSRPSVISIHIDESADYVTCCAPETSHCHVIGKLLACVLAGILFGWCMEKSRGE